MKYAQLLKTEKVFAIIISLSLGVLAYVTAQGGTATAPWYSVAPPLIAVALALITRKVIVSLLSAIVAGGLLSQLDSPIAGATASAGFIWSSASDSTNLQILLFVVLVMGMISVMIKSGGMQGIVHWLSKFAKDVRSTKLVTIAMGLALFIDDYANTMIIGSALRPMTDKMKISREKLAFLVDATAAPVAGLAIVSTWIGYEVGLFDKTAETLGIAKDGYSMFFDALSYRFYCMMMIIFVLLNTLTGRDFGPMLKAEQRARKKGKLLASDAKPATSKAFSDSLPDKECRVSAWAATLPILSLFVVLIGGLWLDGGGNAMLAEDPLALVKLSAWRTVFTSSENSILLLALSSAVGLFLASVLALAISRLPLDKYISATFGGFKASILPITILILAWSLKGACDALQTGNFLSSVLADKISPLWFPVLLFVVGGMTAFATGTSWGTMAILIPTAIPVAFQLDGGVYGMVTMISLGAVLDGAIFGDHCSPLSDTTIMSSISSSCDHIHHVQTQIPYSLLVAGVALIAGYIPAALGVPTSLCLLAATVLMFFALRLVGKTVSST